MIKIPTVKEFFEMQDTTELVTLIEYSELFKKPIDHYGIGRLEKQSFEYVNTLKDEFSEGYTIEKYLGFLTDKGIYVKNDSLLKFIQSFRYLESQVAEINTNEALMLGGEGIDEDQENAGIESLNVLGWRLQAYNLALTFPCGYTEDVKKRPYDECILDLYTAKVLSNYQKNLMEIKRIKAGN